MKGNKVFVRKSMGEARQNYCRGQTKHDFSTFLREHAFHLKKRNCKYNRAVNFLQPTSLISKIKLNILSSYNNNKNCVISDSK